MNPIYKFLLLLALTSTMVVSGQSDSTTQAGSIKADASENSPKFVFGIAGGPNLFGFINERFPSESIIGISTGLDLQYHFGKRSSIVIDLFWEKKTFAYNFFYGSYKYDLQSVTFPIMYRGSIGKKNILFLNGGLFFAHQYSVTSHAPYENYSSKLSTGYAGFAAGIGARIRIGARLALSLEARDYYSIGKIYQTPQSHYFDYYQSGYVSNTANLLIGISYGFGKKNVKRNVSQGTADSASVINPQRKKLEIGVESGINFTQLNGRSMNNISKQNGITSGLTFQYNFKNNLSLQTAAYYTMRNYSSSHYQRKYNYLSIPLLVKCNFGKKTVFYIAGGPYTEMLLSQSIDYTNSPYYAYYESPLSKTPYLGAVAGMGLHIPIKEYLSISLDAKYWTGRTKDLKKSGITINTESLLLGFRYNFGEKMNPISKTQKKDSIKKENTKVHIKTFYGLHVTYRNKTSAVSSFHSSDLHGDSWNSFNYQSDIEIPANGKEVGLLLEIEQSKHWNINTGFTIDNQGFTTSESDFYIYYDSRVGPVMSQHSIDTLENDKLTYKYRFLTIPFILNYQIKIKRASFYIGIGIEPKLLLNSSITFSDEKQYSDLLNGDGYKYDDDQKKLSEKISGTIFCSSHLGVSVPIGKKLFLFVEPDFKMALGHTNKISQLWSYGCRAGIKFGEIKKHGPADSVPKSIFFKPFYSIKNSFRKQLNDITIIQTDAYNSYRYNSEEEIPKVCSEVGLLFEIRLSEHLNINTGLSYEQRNFSTNKTKFTFISNSPWNPSSHVITDELNYKFQFLSFPILLNAEMKVKKASVYIGTGLEVKRLLYSSIGFAHEYSNLYAGPYKGDNYSYFWDVHLGVSLPLSKKLSFFFEPNIENGLNKIPEGGEMDLQLWSYGCKVGLKL